MTPTSSIHKRIKHLQSEEDNCVSASIAYVLDFPIKFVPNFYLRDEDEMWQIVGGFLCCWGLKLSEVRTTKGITLVQVAYPDGEHHLYVEKEGEQVFNTYEHDDGVEFVCRYRIVPL